MERLTTLKHVNGKQLKLVATLTFTDGDWEVHDFGNDADNNWMRERRTDDMHHTRRHDADMQHRQRVDEHVANGWKVTTNGQTF